MEGTFKRDQKKPYITIGLIAINVILFFIVDIVGRNGHTQAMINWGAAYTPYIMEEKEYWRLFTSVFLHFDIQHLLNNMIMLGAAGVILEKAMGHGLYLALYLLSGISGSLLSYGHAVMSSDSIVSAGASGAIFGVVGALFLVVLLHRGKYEDLTPRGMVLLIALSLYFGFTTEGVDNYGHVGGLLAGILLGAILYRKPLSNG